MRTAITSIAILALILLAGCQSSTPLAPPQAGDSTPAGAAAPPAGGAAAAQGSGEAGPIHCLIEFEATVRQGPSKGAIFKGIFDFKLDATGALSGTLMQQDQSAVPAAGQVTGRAVNLAFTAGKDKFVFGVGTAVSAVTNDTCGTALGGPFVGPEAGDAGDWLAKRRFDTPSSTPGCEVACGP